jgi:kanamycin kinase/aminoglycoside 3'-phosphotransferase-3
MTDCRNPDSDTLYADLASHLPEEDFVFSHGDYCLPNIFLDGENPVGFLDLGQAGIADRWQDIYWCVWSMHYNFCEFFGMAEDAYARWQSLLFDELGIPYDAEKLRWYQTLEDLWEMTE